MVVGAGSDTIGGVSANPWNSQYASLALDSSGNPVVAWNDDSYYGQLSIRRFEGTTGTWADVELGTASGGGVSDNQGISEEPVLAVDGSGNMAVAWLGYTHHLGDRHIFVKRYDTASDAWVEV